MQVEKERDDLQGKLVLLRDVAVCRGAKEAGKEKRQDNDGSSHHEDVGGTDDDGRVSALGDGNVQQKAGREGMERGEQLDIGSQAHMAPEEAALREREREEEKQLLDAANIQIQELQKEKGSLQGVVELLEKEIAREKEDRAKERKLLDERSAQLMSENQKSSVATAHSAAKDAVDSANMSNRGLSNQDGDRTGMKTENSQADGTFNGEDCGDGRTWRGGKEDEMQRDLALLRKEVEQARGEILEKERRLQRYYTYVTEILRLRARVLYAHSHLRGAKLVENPAHHPECRNWWS